MKHKGKLLMLLSRDILLADGGREKLLCDAITRMSGHFEIHCLYFKNGKSLSEKIREDRVSHLGIHIYEFIPMPSLPEMAWNFLSKNGTIQESIFFSRKSMALLEDRLKEGDFDAVYFDMVRLYRYAERLAGSASVIMFDLDDLLSQRYAAMASASLNDMDVSGSYRNFSIAGKISRLPVLRNFLRLVLFYESRNCLRRESQIRDFSSVVLLTSPEERRVYINRHEKCPPVFSNFPVIRLAHSAISGMNASRQLIWLGNNNVPHNRMALKVLIEEILPDLDGFQLAVIGSTPGNFSSAYAKRLDISFLGFVEDLGEYLVPGRIMVAPFIFGSGIKIKILEAMAAGVVVVTNETGFQGIPSQGNHVFRPISDLDEMKSEVLRLCADPKRLENWIAEQDETLKRHFSKSSEADVAEIVMASAASRKEFGK